MIARFGARAGSYPAIVLMGPSRCASAQMRDFPRVSRRSPARTRGDGRADLPLSNLDSTRADPGCRVERVRTDPSELVRQLGLRVTVRRSVLRAVAGAPHVTADVVAETVRGELGSVSLEAAYDALAALTENGLLRRIQPGGSPACYEDRVGDNHHHLVCRVCERMVDVDCAVGDPPRLTAVEDFGYEIDEAEIIYWGRCPECHAATPAASDGRSAGPVREKGTT
jgi:Fe2+ or Zn2+ uptake regulation protein